MALSPEVSPTSILDAEDDLAEDDFDKVPADIFDEPTDGFFATVGGFRVGPADEAPDLPSDRRLADPSELRAAVDAGLEAELRLDVSRSATLLGVGVAAVRLGVALRGVRVLSDRLIPEPFRGLRVTDSTSAEGGTADESLDWVLTDVTVGRGPAAR
ncbi:MAG: hypothetical protein LKI24_12370 [Acidipropionibacterium sp.]|nr:hypothetical protein [Acidipropionibacterium sp.]